MKSYPPMPGVEDAPAELFAAGHLWLQEKIDGAQLRFRLLDSGRLEFGDADRTFEPGEVPAPYRHAVRHVRERLDRETLRASVEDVSSVVFVGEATHRHVVDYDWDRLPSFLGFDVWSGSTGRFLAPDEVERVFDRLGLRAVDAFEKEVRAADFDPASYEIPASDWYDGPAAGVVFRDKTGGRAALVHPQIRDADEPEPADATAEELARRYVTPDRVERVVRALEASDRRADFDAVYERVLDDVFRRHHRRLCHREASVDPRAFRSAVAARTREVRDADVRGE